MADSGRGMHRETVREAVTMALYLSLSLLAVLLAVPASTEEDPVALVILTALGLLVAHLVAFSISSRLVSEGVFDAESRRVAAAQVAAGLAVVALVTVPMLLFDAPTSLYVAQALLVLVVVGVGYLAARAARASVLRSVAYVAVVVLAVACVLVLKALVGH
jgi:FtsH-binding integral membrane protein